MKYLYTTANRNFALLLMMLLGNLALLAQTTTFSPYSRYGIGLVQPKYTNGNFGMLGTGYAWRPMNYKPQIYDSLSRSDVKLNDRGSNFINIKNPASFSNHSLTTFEAGIFGQSVNLENQSGSQTENSAFLSHMMIAMPIASKWGVGFGIRPYSKVGYEYQNINSTANGQQVENLYTGSGGLSQIFVATSVELINHLSLGVSGNYLFGNISDERRVIYNNSSFFFNTLDQTELNVNAFTFDLGLQYFKNLNSKYRMVLGLTSSPISEVNAKQKYLLRNYDGDIDFEDFKDTIADVSDVKTTIPIGSNIGFGVSFENKGEWMIGLDYTNTQFEEENITAEVQTQSFSEISLGFEKFNDLTSFGSYWKRMGYRAGLRYNSGYLNINGEDIQEFGIGFGIAMPLRKSFSTLNFGIEVGQRGKTDNELIEERFVNFQFGVTINDRWFIKRKYD